MGDTEQDELSETVRRCKVTDNPCGTDTWGNGYTCSCDGCQAWLLSAAKRTVDLEQHCAELTEALRNLAYRYRPRSAAGCTCVRCVTCSMSTCVEICSAIDDERTESAMPRKSWPNHHVTRSADHQQRERLRNDQARRN